ncbi:terminase small subunit [Paraferrimonas sedimenticola]|uniref:Terminase small subunit n=1 Tax=Paraferrimonas sedimenticola TaxID=375674 RepID=A0AA37RTE7_9GAMM|nr:terminase small subunit [Paraferrimonas sedimenticola]GLP95296.1 hypothetical protein GCM10007895_06020 [Paraferrimonas sedimenticola]
MAKADEFDWSGYTGQQRKFVLAYIADKKHCATHAAEEAEYKHPKVKGSQLLKNDKIKAAIAWHMERLCTKYTVTADRVVQELAKIAFFDMRELYHDNGLLKRPDELPAEVAAALSGIKTRVDEEGMYIEHDYRTSSKLHALELLGKNLKMFTDKIDLNIKRPLVEINLMGRGNKPKS